MKTRSLILTAIVSLALFIKIIIGVSKTRLQSLDEYTHSIMPLFQNNFSIILSKIINIAFDAKTLLLITIILCVLFWIRKNKKESYFLGSLMIIGAGIIYLIKELVQRARPLDSLITETSFSFPSGHATIGIIFLGILTYIILNKTKSKKIEIITLSISTIMVLIIGLSRLILNAHWLTDVIAGFCLGLFILTSGILIRNVLEKR